MLDSFSASVVAYRVREFLVGIKDAPQFWGNVSALPATKVNVGDRVTLLDFISDEGLH